MAASPAPLPAPPAASLPMAEPPTTKLAAVAGMFYPAEPAALAAALDGWLDAARPPALLPKVLVVPHAGYVYSAPIAASAYALLRARRGTIARVVLLGPAHRVPVDGIASHGAAAWETPLGTLPADRDLVARAEALPGIARQEEAFVQEHSLEVQFPFLRHVLGPVPVAAFLVGAARPERVAALLQALWGGPETVILISSDLSHYLDDAAAKAKDAAAARAIELLRADLVGDDQACGRHALRGLLLEARRRDLRATTLDLRTSGDTAGPKDRVVGYGAFAFEYAATARLPEADRAELGRIAHWVLGFAAEHGRAPKVGYGPQLAPCLKAQRAVFVTLLLDGTLRGCVGSVTAHRSLVEDVVENTWKAGFGDPRFPPLTAQEARRVAVSISILSHLRPIDAPTEAALCDALHPDVDGLVLRDSGRSALFLPSVWASLPEPRAFVVQLKRKAGLAADHWSPSLEALRFGTESFACPRPGEMA